MMLQQFILSFLLTTVVPISAHTVALGNLAVVIRGEGVLSDDGNPIKAATSDLWCQARKDGEIQEITWARFIRTKDRKVIEAQIDPDNRRARLVFGEASAADSGKYRCEIRTKDGELVFGNMFAYSRPVVHTNSSDAMSISPSDPTLVIAPPLSSSRESTAHIRCPIYAYPHPEVVWYKDGMPIEPSAKIAQHKNSLEISALEDKDAGMYRCVASNEFPIYVDGPEQEFEVKIDRELKVGRNMGWLLPLIIILITLLLLFIIIYSCQAWKRYKADQYHVAERERQYRNVENQRLADNNKDY
ncbi:unnamed protein product [Cylicocyclus nassatus]|uniref:Ig-like domain-containing protein n=1 Tax=Cylicocyclus nassatus TaxID=53992 RepID=A0AA36GGA9_CYLNA|nr:unnamed protein product [Cylicocyclus nassatus]